MFDFYKVKSREFGVELDSETFTNYLITYITNAHIGILLKWLKGGCEESIDEMAMFIETFTINGVFKTVGISFADLNALTKDKVSAYLHGSNNKNKASLKLKDI